MGMRLLRSIAGWPHGVCSSACRPISDSTTRDTYCLLWRSTNTWLPCLASLGTTSFRHLALVAFVDASKHVVNRSSLAWIVSSPWWRVRLSRGLYGVG